MRASNGQVVGHDTHAANNTGGTRQVPKINVTLTPREAEFLEEVQFCGAKQLSLSLKMVHDMALYHSDVPIDETEKSALYDMKLLWEGFERMGEEL